MALSWWAWTDYFAHPAKGYCRVLKALEQWSKHGAWHVQWCLSSDVTALASALWCLQSCSIQLAPHALVCPLISQVQQAIAASNPDRMCCRTRMTSVSEPIVLFVIQVWHQQWLYGLPLHCRLSIFWCVSSQSISNCMFPTASCIVYIIFHACWC